MLVLTRKPCQKLFFGSEITVTVLKVRGNQVRIGIEAPVGMAILRGELHALPKRGGVSGRTLRGAQCKSN